MKLTKDQSRELKKIDSTLGKISRISTESGVNLEELVLAYNAGIPDITVLDQENLAKRSKSRQDVFRRSQQQQRSSETKKVKVLVKR